MAICKVFNAYCKDNDIKLHEQNFTLSYDTNIPLQVRSHIISLNLPTYYCQIMMFKMFIIISTHPRDGDW